MTSVRLNIAVLGLVSACFSSPLAWAETGLAMGSMPSAGNTQASAPGNNLTALAESYSHLQQVWDDCYSLKATCSDLLDEGRNAPARKKWVDYYVTTAQQTLTNLKTAYNQTTLPANLQGSVGQRWTDAGTAINAMQGSIDKLKAVDANLKSPTDDKYPAAFWGPTHELQGNAVSLDKSIVDILAALDASPDNAALTAAQQAAAAKGTTGTLKGSASAGDSADFNGLLSAAHRIDTQCLRLAGELDRFNMSYGKAPKTKPADMFYGGAFTKQEILSEYKYMPTFVFTTDPQVAMFSYRLPPRKNMLAYYSEQLGKLLDLMDSELLDIQARMPAAQKDATAAPWNAIKQQFVDARTQYLSLYKLIQNTSDDQLDKNIREDATVFGQPVIAIGKDMDKLRAAINDFRSIEK